MGQNISHNITEKEIFEAIELSNYAAMKSSEVEDYSIQIEEDLAQLRSELTTIKRYLISAPIGLIIGFLIGLLV